VELVSFSFFVYQFGGIRTAENNPDDIEYIPVFLRDHRGNHQAYNANPALFTGHPLPNFHKIAYHIFSYFPIKPMPAGKQK
jgi:hypothetical protein